MEKPKGPTPERVMQYAWGYAATLIIDAALHHKYFDHLDGPPKTAEEVARATGTSERGARSILNALVGLQLVSHSAAGYALAPDAAAFLVSTKPAYYGSLIAHLTQQLLPKWMHLREIARTGKPAMAVNARDEGSAFFSTFVESLYPLSQGAARALGHELRLDRAAGPVNVLDLAAGSGVWGITLAEMSPQVRIRAVDWPEVLEVTRRVAARHGVADRLSVAPGDLLQADFGSGQQVATLGHILHSEGVKRSQELLARTFEALAPGGTIAIMEFVPNDERTGPPQALLFAVNMLVNTEEGDTFTFAEISGWLRECGFVNPRLLDVPGPSPLILANRP